MSRKLVITDGTRERELQLVGRLVVGRDPSCDISDDHSLLSRRHAEFVTTAGAVTVRDLGSRNGVFVNGNRAAERTLDPGDIVQIGPLRARYVVDAAPISIIPEALDDDRTAMLRKPELAGAAAVAVPASPPAAPSASVLEDSDVPHVPVDEDVTRMVPGPALHRPNQDGGLPAADDEVTKFTPGPLVPEFAAAVLRPVAPAVTAAPVAAAPAPAAAPAALPQAPAQAAVPAADDDLARFVLIRVMLLALIAVAGTVAASSIVPRPLAILLSLLIAGGAAVMVAGIITGRAQRGGIRS